MRKDRLKLRPHYFWLSGIFIAGGLITSAIFSLPETSETYAYSAEDEWRTLANITYMQEMTAKICENTPKYADVGLVEYDLIDNRGTSPITYKVAKLADENCWMTQNLRLPAGISLTSGNSNVTSISVSPYPYPSAVQSTGNGAAYVNDPDYGYWYTWAQATAGTGGNSGDAPSSICPKNWVLPSGGAATVNGSFQKLYDSTTSGRQWIEEGGISGDKGGWVIGGAFFPAAGYNGGSTNFGTLGYYWSRTAVSSNSSNAYYLSFTSSNVHPQNIYDKTNGLPVRCVAALTDPSPYPEIPVNPNPSLKDPHSGVFSIEVKDAITVAGVKFTDGSGSNVILSAMPGELVTGKIDVTIGSNVNYKINLSAEKPDLASTAGDTHKIPAITQPLTAEQLKTNYGWGVMKKTDVSTDATVYTGLTSTGETFYTSDTPAGASTSTQFNVGVSVPPTLPADIYSTEVTVTAIATQ